MREVAKHERSVRVARGDGKRLTAVSVGVRISNVRNQILSNTLILTRFANEANHFHVISSRCPASPRAEKTVTPGPGFHRVGSWRGPAEVSVWKVKKTSFCFWAIHVTFI